MDIIRIPTQLSALLRAARLQRGLTQAGLAKQLGISIQAFSKLENNASRASFQRIHQLCLLLGLELTLQPKGSNAESLTPHVEW